MPRCCWLIGIRDFRHLASAGLHCRCVGRRALLKCASVRRAAEQLRERRAEGATHGAVDEEVGRIAEQDDEVAHQRRDGAAVARENTQLKRVLRYEKYQSHGLRELDGEEHTDNGHQHQGRAVAFCHLSNSTSTTTTVRTASILVFVAASSRRATHGARLEQTAFALLGAPHRADEKRDN